jgi:hypothetical protein
MHVPPPKPKSLWGETTIKIGKRWFVFLSYDLSSWQVGFGFDVYPTEFGIALGPISIGFERNPEPYNYDDLPDWGFTLYRVVIKKMKLEMRFELDLNIWLVGYSMADIHDHGIYLGPFNIQIEYDKFYDKPWPWGLEEQKCDCEHEADR